FLYRAAVFTCSTSFTPAGIPSSALTACADRWSVVGANTFDTPYDPITMRSGGTFVNRTMLCLVASEPAITYAARDMQRILICTVHAMVLGISIGMRPR